MTVVGKVRRRVSRLLDGWVDRVVTVMVVDPFGGSPGSYRTDSDDCVHIIVYNGTPGSFPYKPDTDRWSPQTPVRVDNRDRGLLEVVSEVT